MNAFTYEQWEKLHKDDVASRDTHRTRKGYVDEELCRLVKKAVNEKNLVALEFLLVSKPVVFPTRYVELALTLAVQKGDADMVRVIVEHGADATSKGEYTLLQEAVKLRNPDVVRELSRGIEARATPKKPWCPYPI